MRGEKLAAVVFDSSSSKISLLFVYLAPQQVVHHSWADSNQFCGRNHSGSTKVSKLRQRIVPARRSSNCVSAPLSPSSSFHWLGSKKFNAVPTVRGKKLILTVSPIVSPGLPPFLTRPTRKMFKFVAALFLIIVAMASAGDFYCNQFNNNCLGCMQAAAEGSVPVHTCTWCPIDGICHTVGSLFNKCDDSECASLCPTSTCENTSVDFCKSSLNAVNSTMTK